jgi:hydrogenase maturation protein HypF
MIGNAIRVRGLVQGVGFRPTVWRIARECGLAGDVRNDGEGVLIRAWGEPVALEALCRRLREECPPLGRVDSLERSVLPADAPAQGFEILSSVATAVHTGVVPDAATCPACRDELFDPTDRRFRYPFTNCTHCGPRLTIVRAIPYDRANTSMAAFPLCPDCAAEYRDPADRRFHAQPNACPVCGPRVWLQNGAGERIDPATLAARDAVEAASRLLARGRILAIKGIGGFHLACDACDQVAVAELRRRKRRHRKPFALMARDLQVIRRYARLGPAEKGLLADPAAPIVLLAREGGVAVAAEVAPGQSTLGFMLPYSPLHHLLLAEWERPLVMTSGNLSEEPQCTANEDAAARLNGLADAFLLHDREIVNGVDDSVLRVMDGEPRLLRRARGYAPAPLELPPGFGDAPPVLALGGELKSTLCLLRDGRAIPSQHLGDLEEARTAEDFERALDLYLRLFQHRPRLLALDRHPDYRSTRLGRALAEREGLMLERVQHHFAHIAALLADNGWPLDAGPVLGIALDGLGYGDDGTLWGGEFLRADYRGFERLGHLAPVALPGGVRAILEPWRNTYAQLARHPGWDRLRAACPDLELTRDLESRPLQILDTMLAQGINSPLSSSCGRLFDAVAAALGVCRDRVSYEGQAAVELETLAAAAQGEGAYPLRVVAGDGTRVLEPGPLWDALLRDLVAGVGAGVVAARFHRGLAAAVAGLARELAGAADLDTVGLSGGVFQNRILLEEVAGALRRTGLRVLLHRRVPSNDGGLSLGQAAVAAARALDPGSGGRGSAPPSEGVKSGTLDKP